MFMRLWLIFTLKLVLQPGDVFDISAPSLAGQLGSDFPFA